VGRLEASRRKPDENKKKIERVNGLVTRCGPGEVAEVVWVGGAGGVGAGRVAHWKQASRQRVSESRAHMLLLSTLLIISPWILCHKNWKLTVERLSDNLYAL
jgi:hypothetical protein